MVHKQGIKPVSEQHLQRRHGVYYYRRRVPLPLVKIVGKKVIQHSLETRSFNEAKKRRTLYDAQWDVRFEAYAVEGPDDGAIPVQTSARPRPMSDTELVTLVRDYVERHDRQAAKQHASCHSISPQEAAEMKLEAELQAQTLRARNDLQTQQWLYLAGNEVLKPVGNGDEIVQPKSRAKGSSRETLSVNRHMIRFYDLDSPMGDVELVDGKMVFHRVIGDGLVHTIESMRRGRSDVELFHRLPGIFCGQFWAGHVSPDEIPGPDDIIEEPPAD